MRIHCARSYRDGRLFSIDFGRPEDPRTAALLNQLCSL